MSECKEHALMESYGWHLIEQVNPDYARYTHSDFPVHTIWIPIEKKSMADVWGHGAKYPHCGPQLLNMSDRLRDGADCSKPFNDLEQHLKNFHSGKIYYRTTREEHAQR